MTLFVGHLLEVGDVLAELDLVREPGVGDGLVVEVHRPLVLDGLEQQAVLQAGSEDSHGVTGSSRTGGRPSGRPGPRSCRWSMSVVDVHAPSPPNPRRGPAPRRRGRLGGCGGRDGGSTAAGCALVDVLGLVDLDRRLLGGVTRLHVQVVGRLHAALPRREVDVHHVAEVARLEVHVAADRLVDPLLRARRDLEERVRRELEARLVDLLDVVRDRVDVLDVALRAQDRLAHVDPRCRASAGRDQVAVHLEELAVAGGAAEDLRELRVEAGRGAGDETDGCRGRDRHERRVAHAALDLHAQRVPVEAGRAVDLDLDAAVGLGQRDRVEGHEALRPARCPRSSGRSRARGRGRPTRRWPRRRRAP